MVKSGKIGFFIAFMTMYFIMSSSLALAWEWDNVKDYDTTTKTVTVSNSLLWMLETGDVAKIKLNSELHRTVIDNNEYAAEFTITNYEKDYANFIKSIEFYDYYKYTLGLEEEKQGTFIYKFWDADYTTTRTINVTEEICATNKDIKNLTEECNLQVVNSYEETLKGKWVSYDEKNPLPLGEVTIRAFYTGELKPGERIEFIPTFFGVRVTDWADFGAAIPYEFSRNMSSTGVEDGFGQTFTIGTNGTNVTHTFKGFSMILTTWTGTPTTCRIILLNVTPAGVPNMTAKNLEKFTNCAEIVENQQNNFSFASDVILTNGTRYFFGFNATGATMGHQYYATANIYQGGNDYFMAGTGGAWTEQANIDNWFIEYGEPLGGGASSLTVNLNLPISGTTDSIMNYIFNANVTSVTALNLTNATLFIWLANTTLNLTRLNTTYVGNNITTWNVSLGIANYTWNVFACGVNSTSTYCRRGSANFSLNVTATTYPSITIISPSGYITSYVTNNSNLTLNISTANAQACWVSYLNFTNITNQYQYQENSDEFSVQPGNIYMNYTKPLSATNRSIWQIKLNETTMNITLNNSCWDYLPDKIMLDLYSVYDNTASYIMISKAYCKNATAWVELAQANSSVPSALLATGNVAKRVYDGNWTRGASYDNFWGEWTGCGPACYPNWTFFYEDAIYWVEDKPISCTATSFYPYSSTFARFYVNNSFGIVNSSLASWSYVIMENSINYSKSTLSSNLETFTINLSYDSNYYSSISVYLKYNNTIYSSSKVGSGSTSIYTSSIYVPSTTTSINKSFYWVIYLSNSTSTSTYNSTSNNQSINPVFLDNCSTYSTRILNISLFDEDDFTPQYGLIETTIELYPYGSSAVSLSYNRSNSGVQNISFCISSLNNVYTMDYKIRYKINDSYSNEYKYAQSVTLINTTSTQIVNLYDLLGLRSTTFVINVKGSDLSSLSDAVVDVQRQYISINQFISVESPITDADGKTVAHLLAKDAVYNFVITKNGQLIGSFNNYIVKCQNELTSDCKIDLNVAQATMVLDDYSHYGNLSLSYNLDKDTRILQMSYVSIDSVTRNVELEVIKNNNSVCSVSSIGSSGTLSCNLPSSYGNTSFTAEVYSDNDLVGKGYFDLSDTSSEIFGGTKVVIGLLMYSTITLLFLGHPAMIIVGSILGMFFAGAFHVVDGGTMFGNVTIIAFFVVAGGILIYIISKKS